LIKDLDVVVRFFLGVCHVRRLLPCIAVLCLVPSVTGSLHASPPSNAAPIQLEADISDAPQRIFHARLVIPVEPGPLVLNYPKWIPGNHGPTGPIADVAGLKMHADGKEVPWRRDDVDMYAFHCTVPEGARTLVVALDLLAAGRGGFGDATQNIAVLRWNQVVLYPKGKPIDSIDFQASVKIPTGWKMSTSLPIESREETSAHFGRVSLDTLVDSPVIAGLYHREIRLGKGEPAHYLDLVADSPAALEITPKQKANYEKLVAEAGALFGSRHYRSYRFLVTLSDKMPSHGLEHHECSDDGMPEHSMADDEAGKAIAYLLPHEYVHSWNGKFRRPAGLVTPTYQEANNTRLLWVYEGLTEYLGTVLTARSGLWTLDEAKEYLAMTADQLENHKGRQWRPLEDTTLVAPMRAYDAMGWTAWRRSVDYYDEGTLIWLEVDTKIRQLTKGKRSLDDFCRRFHGGPGGQAELKPYTFEEVVADLNAIAPYDWKTLLTQRQTETAEHAPLAGFKQGGWRVTLGEKPTGFEKAVQGLRKRIDLSSSIGLSLNPEGAIGDVVMDTPAYKAGVGPGMKLVAVNSRKFSPKVLDEAISAAKKHDQPILLLVEDGDIFRTYRVDYRGGAQHARLERLKDQPDLLSKILAPLTKAPEKKPG
jgi:predicted metalloprotease with PDZ domain